MYYEMSKKQKISDCKLIVNSLLSSKKAYFKKTEQTNYIGITIL